MNKAMPLPRTVPDDKRAALAEVLDGVCAVRGVIAVALGGSYARGTQHPGSDIDLGLYYSESQPFVIEDIRQVAEQVATSPAVVTDFYEWGAWVNGGAWIPTRVGKVDFLYRNVDQVRRVIEDAHAGKVDLDFCRQPPYGFHGVTYLGETQVALPLYDPSNILIALKKAVASFPPALKHSIVREYLWGVEVTLLFAHDFATRADVYNTAGCLTRGLSYLTQVLFALNETYFIADKGAIEAIEAFPISPRTYADRVNQILARPGRTSVELARAVASFEALFHDVVGLAGGLYRPKYAV
jgi:hypothetical protein